MKKVPLSTGVTMGARGGSILRKVPLILGILGVLLGGVILLISLLLPVVTNGRTSWDEALIGIIPGALILVVSFVLALIGVVLLVMKR